MPLQHKAGLKREGPFGPWIILTAGCLGLSILLLFLLQLTPASLLIAAGTCPPVQNTLKYTFVYGSVTIGGLAAPIGSVVEASSPRSDVVGCFVVTSAGEYGAMPVYGEDTSVSPPIPGMRTGEPVAFRVNGAQATADPALTWTDDKTAHQVNLSATSAPCYDFDNSGQVDLPDIMRVASRWRAKCGDPDPRWPSYDPLYDIDDDCDIDIVDIMLVVKHWGETCG
jgi:hypothetical protein